MIVTIYTGPGDMEKMFEYLENYYVEGGQELFVCTLKNDPQFYCLRNKDRFIKLINVINY